jgi:type VI secretion system protein ImpM
MTQRVKPGFFGKLPSRGDFVARRLAGGFVTAWDEWLQAAIAQSRETLGERWLDAYLTSPIWRFALSPGFCGNESYCGVLVPSVDRVGRYFPLVAATPCDPSRALPQVARALEGWYAGVEELLLAALADEPLDLEDLDARLAELLPAVDADRVQCDWRFADAGAAVHWQCAVPESSRLDESLSALLGAVAGNERQRYALWWTQGSERVEPCLLVTDGFPAPGAYTAMLDGGWAQHWRTARIERDGKPPARPPVPALACRSAAMTDPGKEREINEDSYVGRDDLAVWIVADGLGGHRAGNLASRMVTSVANELDGATIGERAAELARAVRVVNGCLQVVGELGSGGELVGSTVAALLIDGAELACIWAGDSRIYRLRDGRLEQLSRDHVEDTSAETRTHFITRAVGGPGELQLDIEPGEVLPGDRYLLCTDGLYGELDLEQIAAGLACDTPEKGCAELRAAVLAGDARDNLTGVIVHVSTQQRPAE